MSLLAVEGLVKHFGGLTATDRLNLEVRSGEIHAVIGPNGAGKTTLIHQLSGTIAPDQGRILFEGANITRERANRRALRGIARSYQTTSVFPEFTVLENAMLAVQAKSGHSFRFWRPALAERRLVDPAREVLDRVGLGAYWGTRTDALAYGQKRQLEIAMALAVRPKLLLLDEPMAGMSHHESGAVVELLRSLKGHYSIILVEHDMSAVFALADRITVMVYGRAIACGRPDEIRGNVDVRNAYLGDQEDLP